MAYRILLVNGDPTLLALLSKYLQDEGHYVQAASSGPEALRLADREQPDIAVLDVMMPGMDGWGLCARLRELTSFPIILLSAGSSEDDKLRGFRLGMDDYVTKPFSLAELAARIRVVLDRNQPKLSPADALYTTGTWSVDMAKRWVTCNERLVPLTPTEFRLLQYLIQQDGRPVPEAALAQAVWGIPPQGSTARVRQYISRLRQKVEDDPKSPARILTIRGFGYRIGKAPLISAGNMG